MIAAAPPPPGMIAYDHVPFDRRHMFVALERADGTQRRVVLRGAYDPAWSPDGRYLAAFRGGYVVVATSGGRVVRRIPAVGSPEYLSWSPDGRWLAYVTMHCAGDCGTVWVVRTGGGGQRRASREQGVSLIDSRDRPYSWSPDGRRIVFTGFWHVVVSNIFTGARHPVVATSSFANPDWSPDGRRLLYRYGEELVTSAPDGSDRRVVPFTARPLVATWSPGGGRIAFIREVGGGDWRLVVSRPDGSQRLLLGRVHSHDLLLWSADGQWVLVAAADDTRFELFRADGRAKPRFVTGGPDGDWR